MSGGDMEAEIDGLKTVAGHIIQLGNEIEAGASATTGVPAALSAVARTAGLAGFATETALAQVPTAVAAAQHTISGRFLVLGDLMKSSAEQLRHSDESAATSIRNAGDLNSEPKGH